MWQVFGGDALAGVGVADGDYGARMPPSRLGSELAAVDDAFNRMVAALQNTERRTVTPLGR